MSKVTKRPCQLKACFTNPECKKSPLKEGVLSQIILKNIFILMKAIKLQSSLSEFVWSYKMSLHTSGKKIVMLLLINMLQQSQTF